MCLIGGAVLKKQQDDLLLLFKRFGATAPAATFSFQLPSKTNPLARRMLPRGWRNVAYNQVID